MTYFQELVDFVKERGGDVESVRKSVIDSAAALGVSTEEIASSILMCMRVNGGMEAERSEGQA